MMKKAVMTGPRQLEIQNFEVPEPGAGEVLVKIRAVGICTWERKYFRGVDDSYPFVGGHEIFATVEEVGPGVAQDLNQGDAVVVASLTRCGECYYCRRGLDNMCENVGAESQPGGLWGPGGFSEYLVVRGYELFRVRDDMDPAVGTLAEPVACVTRSVERGALEVGDTVLVLGAGVMGLVHIVLAKMRGVKVLVSEPDAKRREKAREMGADEVIDPSSEDTAARVKARTEGRGAEAVFFTAGGVSAIHDGVASLVKNGTLVVYGSTGSEKELVLDPGLFHYDEIYLTGVTKHTKDSFRKAAKLLSEYTDRFSGLITERFPFDEILPAFERSESLETYRVVLEL